MNASLLTNNAASRNLTPAEVWLIVGPDKAWCSALKTDMLAAATQDGTSLNHPMSRWRMHQGLVMFSDARSCRQTVVRLLTECPGVLHLWAVATDKEWEAWQALPPLTRPQSRRISIHLFQPDQVAHLHEALQQPDAWPMQQWLLGGRRFPVPLSLPGLAAPSQSGIDFFSEAYAAFSFWVGEYLAEHDAEDLASIYDVEKYSAEIDQPRLDEQLQLKEVIGRLRTEQEALEALAATRSQRTSAPGLQEPLELAASSGDDYSRRQTLVTWVLDSSPRQGEPDQVQAWIELPRRGAWRARDVVNLGFRVWVSEPAWRGRSQLQLQLHLPRHLPLLVPMSEPVIEGHRLVYDVVQTMPVDLDMRKSIVDNLAQVSIAFVEGLSRGPR